MMETKSQSTETLKQVKLAHLRVAGLTRASDEETNDVTRSNFLDLLREEKDKLNDYKLTGIYERY